MVDLQRTEKTAKGHVAQIRRFSKWLSGNSITIPILREYLANFNHKSTSTYRNVLKSLRIFFRDYLKKPQYVESFKFPRKTYKIQRIPNSSDIKRFFNAIDNLKERSLFLLYASSGLRRKEVLNLTFDDIDFKKRMIVPKPHNGNTKNVWVSFYNRETARILELYLNSRNDKNLKIFPMARTKERKIWKDAREKTNLDITPQVLRKWFCSTMGELGVADRYVDAFCGRVPKSILAKHYTDFSSHRLKKIYDNVNLKILN